jgi:hypothetical protein
MTYSVETEYLVFKEVPRVGFKTKLVDVRSKSSDAQLGQIRWHGARRQYVFAPNGHCLFNNGCMKDIMSVIDVLMIERRSKT